MEQIAPESSPFSDIRAPKAQRTATGAKPIASEDTHLKRRIILNGNNIKGLDNASKSLYMLSQGDKPSNPVLNSSNKENSKPNLTKSTVSNRIVFKKLGTPSKITQHPNVKNILEYHF